MINVAVIGVGSIGKHHARIFAGMEDVTLAAIVDVDRPRADEFAEKYHCRAFKDYMNVMNSVDAVSIAVPTTFHFQVAMDFLEHGKHILIEKPITSTLNEAEALIREAEKRNLVLQVGHLERFNAGISLISTLVEKPRFIESQRLSPFLGRGIDVDVTLDLMIHDIDIILSLVKSEITDIRATGAKVLTENIDVAHAWIEFENGCIAEAVTSRIANEKVRQLKVFQHNSWLNLNYQNQELTCYTKHGSQVEKEIKKPEEKEPLKEQLISFIECVRKKDKPVVSGHEGREALKVALRISELVHHGLAM